MVIPVLSSWRPLDAAMMTCDETYHDRHGRIFDKLLEDESLTSALVDEAARLVLDWGMTQVYATACTSEELSRAELVARLARLRHVMRCISERAGQAPAEQQVERVRLLLSRIEDVMDIDKDDEAGQSVSR